MTSRSRIIRHLSGGETAFIGPCRFSPDLSGGPTSFGNSDVYAAAFTPQNGAIVRTDSVRTKAYLQNSETCMRNLLW